MENPSQQSRVNVTRRVVTTYAGARQAVTLGPAKTEPRFSTVAIVEISIGQVVDGRYFVFSAGLTST